MKFTELSFSNIKNEIEKYLRDEHKKAGVLYSPSSPFGQVMYVIEQLHTLSMLYLKNTINKFDLSLPNSNNEKIIRNSAIFAGHIPGRPISSTGTLKLVVKSGIDLTTDLPGGKITIFNKELGLIRNITNGMFYSIDLGQDKVSYMINQNTNIFLSIIQGKYKTTKFTGDNTQNQTYQLNTKSNEGIENFNVEVLVNGEYWSIKKHIYDMLPNEKSCVVRTGFESGVDIIFGNGNFGMIPPINSIIEVIWLSSDGKNGNIFRRTVNDWVFVSDVVDGFGNAIDINDIFDVLIFNDINFGADRENFKFTKSVLPIVSNNFVLGLPEQYAYQIKKLGVFSHVNAYEDNSMVYIVATPNIRLFKNRNSDYFTVSKNAFILDDYEKSKIDKYLKSGGNIQLTKKYKIESPFLSHYIMNIFIIRYSDSNDDSIKSQIIDSVSEYFLNLNKVDRIPKSDLVKILSNINDLHSVDIQFISRKNEDFHRNEKIRIDNKISSSESLLTPDLIKDNINYKENNTIGIDVVLGDILFEPNEIPIIRGGWYDRNGVFFSDGIDYTSMGSINIIRRGVVESSKRNSI